MKKIIFITSIVSLLSVNTSVYAQEPTTVVEKPAFALINWISKNSTDEVVVQNGNGAPLVVQINVINNQDPDSPGFDAPGINIKNCGSTTHVRAGNSAICTTSDATHPVTFTSDSSDPAMGTYQIKQQ